MLRAHVAAVTGLVFLCGALLGGEKGKKEDPPQHRVGQVKFVDAKDPAESFLTITVKEKVPTKEEDMFKVVDKDYRFRTTGSIKVIGLDGKPDRRGLKGLTRGTWVRVEYREKAALEVKMLPPK